MLAIALLLVALDGTETRTRLDHFRAGRQAFAEGRYADARDAFAAARRAPHDPAAPIPTTELDRLPLAGPERAPSNACDLDRLLCSIGKTYEAHGDDRQALRAYRDGSCPGPFVALAARTGKLLDELVETERARAHLTPFWFRADLYAAAGAPCEAASILHDWCRHGRSLDPDVRCDALATRRRAFAKRCAEGAAGERELPGLIARLDADRITYFEEREVELSHELVSPPTLVEGLDTPAVYYGEHRGQRAAVVRSPRLEGREPWAGVARGYWLYLADRAGAPFRGPFYIGLMSYYIRPASPAAASAEDGCLVLRASTSVGRARLCDLELDLARVQADADGDGLTDLLEERIATDPRQGDTDGDGIGDARDPLPLTPGEVDDPEQRVWHAVLARHRRMGEAFRAPRPLTRAPPNGIRVLALPPGYASRYELKFGSQPRARLSDVAFDQERRSALACNTRDHDGRTCYRLARDDGGWRVVDGGWSEIY